MAILPNDIIHRISHEVGLVLEYRGPYGCELASYDDRWIISQVNSELTPPTYDPSDRETPEISAASTFGTAWYLPLHFRRPLRFGRSSKRGLIDVQLPRKSFLSKVHFQIFVSKYRTWMLRCTSKNGVILNGVYLASSQIKPNKVEFRDFSLLLHAIRPYSLPDHQVFVEIPERVLLMDWQYPVSTWSFGRGVASQTESGPSRNVDGDTSDRAQTARHSESTGASTTTFSITEVQDNDLPPSDDEFDDYIVVGDSSIGGPQHFRAVEAKTGRGCVVEVYPEAKEQEANFQYAAVLPLSRVGVYFPCVLTGYCLCRLWQRKVKWLTRM